MKSWSHVGPHAILPAITSSTARVTPPSPAASLSTLRMGGSCLSMKARLAACFLGSALLMRMASPVLSSPNLPARPHICLNCARSISCRPWK